MSWTSGYVADIGYTFGYYPELNPLRANLAFLNTGLVCPQIHTACELGYGQGLSTNLHAAASNTQWWGTDFNPSQAGFAQELSAVSGAGANLYDEAFADFADRPDLPEFDYIGIHGIWSWISHDNRQVLVDFVRRKLAVGGVLYISYNTLPGWAAFAPMRHLMTEHSEIIGAEGSGIVSRIDGAIDFAQKLLETNPLFSKANPLVHTSTKTGTPCILPTWPKAWNRPRCSMPALPITWTISMPSTSPRTSRLFSRRSRTLCSGKVWKISW
jgi:SAM-dependent methyltransferase